MHNPSFVKDEVQEIFDRLDTDGDRLIGFEEFAGVMLELDHEKLTHELRASFDFIDTNRDGRVGFEEFYRWLAPHGT